MANERKPKEYRILDVCPCSFDHADMRKTIARVCTASVDQVRTGADAMKHIQQHPYDLVLINRTLDGPMDGLSLLAALRSQAVPPPMMLISNYADAQASALALGALPGFGRAKIDDPVSAQQIRRALSLEEAQSSVRTA